MSKGIVISADPGLLSIEIGTIFIDASPEASIGDTIYAFLKPEDIALSKTSAQSSIRNSLHGRVMEVWIPGAPVRVKVDCGVPVNALIDPAVGRRDGYFSGSPGLCPVQGKFCSYTPLKR